MDGLTFYLFWGPLGLAFVISLLVTWVTIKLAYRLKIVDDPAKHVHVKVVHTYPVPRGGGVPIFVALLFGLLSFLEVDQHVLGVLLGALVAVVVGLVDDRYDISPWWRLGTNVLSALIVVAVGIGIAYVSNPLGDGVIDLSFWQWNFFALGEWRSIWVLSDLFALIWIVALMNVIGQGAGGIEGQFPGVVAIGAIVVALLSLESSADVTQWPVIILAAVTAGAYLGFLPWNFFPQKIMPGYSGKSLAGYLLAVMTILSTAKVGMVLVVLGVPILDAAYSYVRRIKAGKSPLWGDRGHLHHRLLDAGWSKPQVVYFYWGVTALLGAIALHLNSTQKLYAFLGVGLGMGVLLLMLPMGKREKGSRRKQ